jgi:hypothetical protein
MRQSCGRASSRCCGSLTDTPASSGSWLEYRLIIARLQIGVLPAPPRGPASYSLRNLNQRFDLYRHVKGERAHSDGATCMPTPIAEHLDEKIGAAIYDLRMVGKVRHSVHHSEHSTNANHLIEAAGRVPQRRQQLKANVSRVVISLFDRHIMSNLALRPRAIRIERPRSREKDYVSEPCGRNVVRNGRSDLRKFDP